MLNASVASLAQLLNTGRPIVGPGVYDCLSAKLAEAAGFPMAFLSGYCLSATLLGEPDFGLLSAAEVVAAAERVCSAVSIPIVVDIDTGYGNAFNVDRVVRQLVRCGAAGCFLEDQAWPKRCGHMERKRVIPVEEYVVKLKAALAARGTAPFHVTARTDARAVEGLPSAIARARLYRDAGADAVFIEAPQSVEELVTIRREVEGVTLVANMVEHGKTPLLPASELHAMGYSLIAAPVTGVLAAAHALRDAYATLQAQGISTAAQGRMLGFGEFNDFLGLAGKYAQEAAWQK